MIDKAILKRIERLQQKRSEPVKIWNLYRMPDGSEQRMRWKGEDWLEQMRRWEDLTGAVSIDTIIEVEEGGCY